MSKGIRQFVRNCDNCGRTKTWKEQKKGLLKPLPIPERPWQYITLDFITDLPSSNNCTVILVITDRLTKGVILESMAKTTSKEVAWTLV
jgi:hypothetical protein